MHVGQYRGYSAVVTGGVTLSTKYTLAARLIRCSTNGRRGQRAHEVRASNFERG